MRVLFFILVIFVSFVSAQTQLEKASALANEGNYQKALEIYKEILPAAAKESTGKNLTAKIHFNTGICLYHLGQLNESVAELTEAIETSGGSYQKAYYALGMAQTELKNWPAAKKSFLSSLEIKEDDGEAWFDLALVYLEEKNFEEAQRAFHHSIEYKSIAAADAHNNLGVISILKGNYPAAEREFETALRESNGHSVEARNNLRFCLFYKQSREKDLIANLEFSRRNKNSGV